MERMWEIWKDLLNAEIVDAAKPYSQSLLILLAVVMMWYGIGRGEMETVFHRAVNICLECIGLG